MINQIEPMQKLSSPPKDTTVTKPAVSGTRRAVINVAVILALISFMLIAFQKTVFHGQQISRLYQLAQRDSLFSEYFFPVREAYDPSAYQQHFPNYVFSIETLRRGSLPLWNPLTGCGVPQLADYQATVFNPIRVAFAAMVPNLEHLRAWNLLLVLQITLLAISTFVLGRTLGLRLYSSVFASLTFTFCPLLLGMSDLTINCTWSMPLVMAAFIFAAQKQNLSTKMLAAIACALIVISGHPEPPFFTIAFSSLLYICLCLFKNKAKFSAKVLTSSIMDIALIGSLSFGLSAFMLLPFLEFLKNSDCYKEGLEGVQSALSWNSVFLNFVHPAYGNLSPFLGIGVAALASFALFAQLKSNKIVQGLFVCVLVACLIMIQPGPIASILSWKCFSWFAPKYCWYTLLLLGSVLAAFGFEEYTESETLKGRQRTLSLLFAVLLPGLLLIAAKLIPELRACARIDEVYDQLIIQPKGFTRDLILLGVLLTVGLVKDRFGPARKWAAIVAITVISILSLGPAAKTASPVQSHFEYSKPNPIPFLSNCKERIITMGRHVLCPGTNMVYGIADLVPANVFHPKRFQKFMAACGVTHEGVNQFFDSTLSPCTNLASIKYVLSPLPVVSTDEVFGTAEPLAGGEDDFSFGQDREIKLKALCLRHFPNNNEVLGQAIWEVKSNLAKDLAWQSVLLDEQGRIVWFSDTERFDHVYSKTSASMGRENYKRNIAVIIPQGLAPKEKLTLGIQAFDWRTWSVPKSRSPRAIQNKTIIPLVTFSTDGTFIEKKVPFNFDHGGKRRFKLLLETDKRIRVYENTTSLPAAYIVHKALKVKTPDEALQLINQPNFNPKQTVVLDSLPTGTSALSDAAADAATDTAMDTAKIIGDKVTYTRPDPNTIIINCSSKYPGYLVVTDTFYPGWKAYIQQAAPAQQKDSAKETNPSPPSASERIEATILHGNYLFRSLAVPAGTFTVVFHFEPISFYLGLALGALSLIFIGLVFGSYLKGLRTNG